MLRPFLERHRYFTTIMISVGERKGRNIGLKVYGVTLRAPVITTR